MVKTLQVKMKVKLKVKSKSKKKAKRIKNECETSEHKKGNTEEKTGKKTVKANKFKGKTDNVN